MIAKEKNWGRFLLSSKKSSIGPPSLEPSQPLLSVSGPTLLAFFNLRRPCQLLFSKQVSLDPLSLSFFRFFRQWYLLSLVLWRLSLGSLSMATSLGPSTTTLELSLAVPLSFNWRECTGLSSFNPWSVKRPTTSILTGSTKTSVLIVSSSSWWSGPSALQTSSVC